MGPRTFHTNINGEIVDENGNLVFVDENGNIVDENANFSTDEDTNSSTNEYGNSSTNIEVTQAMSVYEASKARRKATQERVDKRRSGRKR